MHHCSLDQQDFVVKVLKNSSEYRPSDIQSLRKQLDMLGTADTLARLTSVFAQMKCGDAS